MPRKAEQKEPEEEKAPKKKLKFRSAIKNEAFNLFDTQATLLNSAQAVDGFKSLAEVAGEYLPIPWMAMQYVIGRVGIPINTITEFIGAEGVGKSSLVHALIGSFAANNVPCLYINSEAKMLEPDWRLRLYSTSPELSEKIDMSVTYEALSTLDEMDVTLKEWVRTMRETRGVPKDVPLVAAIDSVTKLLNPDEAEAAGWTDTTKKDAIGKGINEVSKKPGVTAKWMHSWTRNLTPFLRENNVTILLVSGQNQDMNTAPSAFIPAASLAKVNKTRIGGNAVNQSAALQFTMTKARNYKQGTEVMGKEVYLHGIKNSYGPSDREIVYRLYDNRAENFKGKDVPKKYLSPAIDMDEALCDLLVSKKVFGLTVAMKKYTSEELGLMKVKPADVVEVIERDPKKKVECAKALSIYGYEVE